MFATAYIVPYAFGVLTAYGAQDYSWLRDVVSVVSVPLPPTQIPPFQEVVAVVSTKPTTTFVSPESPRSYAVQAVENL